jgi:hypothetical protein
VHGHALGRVHRGPREQARPGREERRVLHAARAARAPGRIDDRDVLVGVLAEPQPVEEQRRARRLEVALPLVLALGMDQHRHVDGAQAQVLGLAQRGLRLAHVALEARAPQVEVERVATQLEARVGGPREAVHQRSPARRVHARAVLERGRREARGDAVADDAERARRGARREDLLVVARGQVERDVVPAVVGVELGVGVELVAVPAALALEHAQLGEPVGDEQEVVLVAGAAPDARDLGLPLELDLDRGSAGHRRGQVDREHAALVGRAAVGLAEAQAGQQVVHAVAHGRDALPAPLVLWVAPAQRPAALAQVRRAVVGEGVPVQVEPQLARGHRRRVGPAQRQAAVEQLARVLDARVDGVVGPPGRVGLAEGLLPARRLGVGRPDGAGVRGGPQEQGRQQAPQHARDRHGRHDAARGGPGQVPDAVTRVLIGLWSRIHGPGGESAAVATPRADTPDGVPEPSRRTGPRVESGLFPASLSSSHPGSR